MGRVTQRGEPRGERSDRDHAGRKHGPHAAPAGDEDHADGWGASRAGDGNDLRLVQFNGPTKAEWIQSLEASGLRIMQYIYPNTYIVWGDAASRDAVANPRHPPCDAVMDGIHR